MPDFKTFREKYNPKNAGIPIRVLWIAESPPAGGGYFYFDETSGRNHLFRETVKALGWWPENKTMSAGMDKTPYLKKFQMAGYFLVDLSYLPVNKMEKLEREKVLGRNIPRLLNDLEELDPQRIVIVKATLFDILFSPVRETKFGSRVLNMRSIPFPSHGNQKRYREEIRKLLVPAVYSLSRRETQWTLAWRNIPSAFVIERIC